MPRPEYDDSEGFTPEYTRIMRAKDHAMSMAYIPPPNVILTPWGWIDSEIDWL
jgi:hypothetical protein